MRLPWGVPSLQSSLSLWGQHPDLSSNQGCCVASAKGKLEDLLLRLLKKKGKWTQPLSRPGTESRKELASPCDLGPNLFFSHGGILSATSKQPAKRRCPEFSVPSYRTKNSLRFNKRLLSSLALGLLRSRVRVQTAPSGMRSGAGLSGWRTPKTASLLPPAHTLFLPLRELGKARCRRRQRPAAHPPEPLHRGRIWGSEPQPPTASLPSLEGNPLKFARLVSGYPSVPQC